MSAFHELHQISYNSASETSNATTVNEVRSANFGLVFHVHYIFANSFNFLIIWGLPVSIPCAYFVYTVWHCTGQHCSSIYARTYCLFANTWCPLMSVITTLYYVAMVIFHRRVWYRRFLCAMRVFRHHPHPLGYLCAKFCFFCSLRCWASPWRKITYSITHSLNHPSYFLPWEPKLVLQNTLHLNFVDYLRAF